MIEQKQLEASIAKLPSTCAPTIPSPSITNTVTIDFVATPSSPSVARLHGLSARRG